MRQINWGWDAFSRAEWVDLFALIVVLAAYLSVRLIFGYHWWDLFFPLVQLVLLVRIALWLRRKSRSSPR